MATSRELAKIAIEAMEDKKAIDIKIIDIEKISTLADYFIIASGSNRNQVQAMADAVDEKMSRACQFQVLFLFQVLLLLFH